MKIGKKWLWLPAILLFVFAGWLAWLWLDPGPWAREEAHEIITVNGKSFLVGEFKVHVRLPLNPETRVRYVIPVDAAGKPLPTAADMVFYAPFNGEDGSTFFTRLEWLKPFWEEHGFAVFSLSMAANTIITDDVKQYYIYPECGWYEVITAIPDYLCGEFAIPKRPMLIVGESAGGSLAQRMTQTIPEAIEAAAWCGATRPMQPQRPTHMKLLALNTWGCPGAPSVRKAVLGLRELGGEILHGITPPHTGPRRDYHAAGEDAYMLIRQFIVDAARSRDTGAAFPSEEFQHLWAQLPHTVADTWLEPEKTLDELPVYPPRPDADRVLFLLWEPGKLPFGMMMDALQLLAEQRVIPVAVPMHERFYENPELPGAMLRQVLARPEWSALPAYVAGTGAGGQMAAVAALRHSDARIVRITTLDSAYEYPFEHLSIAANYQEQSPPLYLVYSRQEDIPATLPDNAITEPLAPAQAHPWSNFLTRAAGLPEK